MEDAKPVEITQPEPSGKVLADLVEQELARRRGKEKPICSTEDE